MLSNKIALTIQELLTPTGLAIYYIDQIPSFDQLRNNSGFVGWDIDQINPMHCSEGVEYANGSVVVNFELSITLYGATLTLRNSMEKDVLDVLQPKTSGYRKPLQQYQSTSGFIRSMIWLNTVEYPIPKTGQSNAEMSASVLIFSSSISIME